MSAEIGTIQKLTSPNPFCLVTARRPNGTANVMALSWWTYVSNHPAIVAIVLSSRGYTHELIEAGGEFALCFPGGELKEAAFRCGTRSGRECDKATEFCISLADAEVLQHQVVANCRAVIECRAMQRIEVGNSLMFFGEVVATTHNSAVSQLYAMDGYSGLACV
jgi:flavin reductase (DIM6/NTAB) family NADH-FMN oxidoreductase RutF